MTANDAIVGNIETPIRDEQRSLPALGWLFVAMAALQALLMLSALHFDVKLVPGLTVSADTGAPAGLLRMVASVASVLLPAAILYRAPAAIRMHPLLLIGAAVIATWTVATEAVLWSIRQVNNFGPIETVVNLLPTGAILHVAGILLLGIGLARARGRGPSARAVIAMLVAVGVAVTPAALTYAQFGALATDIRFVMLDLAMALATGFLLAVPLGAWIDGVRPRPFWAVLALVSLAGLAVSVLSAIQLATRDTATSFFIDAFGTQIWVAAFASLATLTIFALALPRGTPDVNSAG
jgi:hypothetical protein